MPSTLLCMFTTGILDGYFKHIFQNPGRDIIFFESVEAKLFKSSLAIYSKSLPSSVVSVGGGEDDKGLHVALPVQHLPQNFNQICQHENNNCYPHWICAPAGQL